MSTEAPRMLDFPKEKHAYKALVKRLADPTLSPNKIVELLDTIDYFEERLGLSGGLQASGRFVPSELYNSRGWEITKQVTELDLGISCLNDTKVPEALKKLTAIRPANHSH